MDKVVRQLEKFFIAGVEQPQFQVGVDHENATGHVLEGGAHLLLLLGNHGLRLLLSLDIFRDVVNDAVELTRHRADFIGPIGVGHVVDDPVASEAAEGFAQPG